MSNLQPRGGLVSTMILRSNLISTWNPEPHSDIDGYIPPFYNDEELEKWRPLLEEILEKNPGIMHYMIETNITACMRGGDRQFVDIWGHHHFRDKSLVGCQECLEWIHA